MSEKIDLFSIEEQIEIVNIVKGIFVYARNYRKALHSEKLLLELLESSCNKISLVIKDKNEKYIQPKELKAVDKDELD